MRILFLLNAFEPDGPGRLVLDIASRLQSAYGFQCEVAAMSRAGLLRENFERSGVRTHLLGGSVAHQIRQLSRLIRDNHFDILHTHLLRADILGRALGKHLHVPHIVSTEHGLHTWNVMGPLVRPLIGWAYRRAARNTDAIVAVSEFVHGQIIEAGLPERQVRLIRNGVDLQVFKPLSPEQRRAARRKLGLDEEAVLFVAAGKMVALKGHLIFCQAMKLVLDSIEGSSLRIQAAIAGDGPEFTRCKKFIERNAIAKYVILAGTLTDQIPDFIACADVLVQPSFGESFGLAPAEAMAAGIPVIASRVGALPELIRDGETGFLIPPGDPRVLSERILDLSKDPRQRQALGKAACDLAREELGIDRTVQAYASLYNN